MSAARSQPAFLSIIPMTVKTPESFARIKALTYLFVDASKRGYLDHLSAQAAIERIGEVEYHPELEELRRKHEIAGLQTIVFAGMSFESAIYDYAAVHLGDQYVRDHLDKLDVISKWVICIRLIAGQELDKSRAPFAALQQLVRARNRLVHHKSEPLRGPSIEAQLAKIMEEDKKLGEDVHNAFRAIVLMSFELERISGRPGWPLPAFGDETWFPAEENAPQLKSIIDDCRRIVLGKVKTSGATGS